jgi:GDP-L-fucose synthase
MAQAVFALENTLPDYLYNVGTGEDLTIKQLAETIQKITGHQGEIIWDIVNQMVPRKLMDISKMHALGWKHQVQLKKEYRKPTIGFVTFKT